MPLHSTLFLRVGAALMLVAVGACGASQATAGASPASAAQPVVVELFQSQGCSSCPPANADLNSLADRADVLALSFAVTYWDQLGWKDTFAAPGYTMRQRDYANAGRGEVATPEFIVNGVTPVVGADKIRLTAAIARAGAPSGGPTLALDSKSVRVGAGNAAGGAATVWLVRYDPRPRNVPIRAGENAGRTLPHRNIVRQLVNLGRWSGRTDNFVLPAPPESGLASAVFVQRGTGGPIIAARKL